MTSPFILWILLCFALVKGRSKDLSPDTLDKENYWNEVTVSDMEQSVSKTDLENQDDVENSEVVYSRRGIDGLRLSIGSSQLSDSENMNLGIAPDDSFNAVSDASNLMSRSSAIEANDSPDTFYENLANLRVNIDPVISSSDVDNQNDLEILNINRIYDPNEGADLSDLNRGGILTLVSRSGHNDLKPSNVGINVARHSTLNGLKNGGRGRVNRLGSNFLNEDGVISADVEDELKSDSFNNLISNNLNNFNNLDTAQKVGRTGSLKTNDASRNELHVSNCNNLNSIGVSRTGINDLEDVYNGYNSNNLDSMVDTNQDSRTEIDNSMKSLALERGNGYGKSSNVDSMSAHNNLELNTLDSKALDRNADKELSNLVERVKADSNGVNELDSNNIDLSKSDALRDNNLMQSLRNGLDRVSLNGLNKAKRLLGPLNLNRGLSDRSNSEIDKNLLNALNVEDDFNALGALVVLSKLVEKPNSLSVLNEADDMFNSRNINTRKDIKKNIDSNLLRNFEAPDDVSEIDEFKNSNPLPHILNNLYNLARSDSANDMEKEIDPQNSFRSLNEIHNNLDQSKVESKSENQPFNSEREDAINNYPSRAISLDDDRLNTPGLDRRGLYIPYGATRPVRKIKPFKLYTTNRPSKPSNIAKYLYRPRVRGGLNDDQNLNSIDNNLDGFIDDTLIVNLKDSRNGNSLNDLLSSIDNNMINGIPVGVNKAQIKSTNAHPSNRNIAENADRSHNLNQINQLNSEGNMKPLTNLNSLRDKSNLLLASADTTPSQRKNPANDNLKLLSKKDINALNNLVPLPGILSSDSNRAGVLYGLVHLDEMN